MLNLLTQNVNLFMQDIQLADGDKAHLQLHVADGQARYQDAPVLLNGQEIDGGPWIFEGTADYDSEHDSLFSPEASGGVTSKFEGSLWDIVSYDITNFLVPGKNNLTLTSARLDDCLSLVVALIDIGPNSSPVATRQGDNAPPQLTPPPSVSQMSKSPEGDTIELTAQVNDPDGDLLQVIWKVAGIIVKTEPVDTSTGPQTITLTHLFPPGNNEVHVAANDSASAPIEVSMTVTVVLDGAAPTMNCLDDSEIISDGQTVYAPDFAPLMGILDDKTALEQLWIVQEPAPGSELPAGEHWITVTVEDMAGNVSSCELLCTVIEMLEPTVSCSANVTELWPPNKRMVDVGFEFTAENADDVEIVVYSNEDDVSRSGRRFSPDADVFNTVDDILALRAERDTKTRRARNTGRVYLIVIRGSNASGQSECMCTVVVPHDQSRRSRAAVREQAALAEEFYLEHGLAPTDYFEVGDGPMRGPKHRIALSKLAKRIKSVVRNRSDEHCKDDRDEDDRDDEDHDDDNHRRTNDDDDDDDDDRDNKRRKHHDD